MDSRPQLPALPHLHEESSSSASPFMGYETKEDTGRYRTNTENGKLQKRNAFDQLPGWFLTLMRLFLSKPQKHLFLWRLLSKQITLASSVSASTRGQGNVYQQQLKSASTGTMRLRRAEASLFKSKGSGLRVTLRSQPRPKG